MRILVTGHQGVVGRVVAARLQTAGEEVVGLDIVDGQDVLDPACVRDAAARCDQVVHLAALDDPVVGEVPDEFLPPSQGSPDAVMAVTVLGTWNVLEAARMAGHQRVIMMSSVDALGVFQGQRPPDYLPIDNEHPAYPRTPYALAKRTAERLCELFTSTTGIPTLCLRPPGIWTAATFEFIRRRWADDPLNDRRPFWEYGAFIALPDVAEAVHCACHCRLEGHATLLLCADEAALAVL